MIHDMIQNMIRLKKKKNDLHYNLRFHNYDFLKYLRLYFNFGCTLFRYLIWIVVSCKSKIPTKILRIIVIINQIFKLKKKKNPKFWNGHIGEIYLVQLVKFFVLE